MTDDLEDRLRAAAPSAPAAPDVAALHERATLRRRDRRRRQISLVAAVAIVVVVALVASLLALRDTGREPAGRVDTRAPHVTWTRVPGIAGHVYDIATGDGTTVAVGSDGIEAAIWTSRDGTSWTLAYQGASPPDVSCQPFCQSLPVSSEFVSVVYATHRFVVTGNRSSQVAGGIRGIAAASTDGLRWTDAEASMFQPAQQPKSNPASALRAVAHFRGEFVAVGDVYTANKRQSAGLSPALWRSGDGVRWTRTILRLGRGFDPYMDGLASRRGTLVATGGYRRGFGAWTSQGLRRWSYHPINRRGELRIVAVPSGFIASGGICVPVKQCRKRVVDYMRLQPTLWWSRSGERWSVTVRLRSGIADFNRVVTSFGPLGVAGKTLVAVGSLGRLQPNRGSTPLVYVSTDGRRWTDDRDAAVFPAGATFTAAGSRGDTLLVAGTVGDQPAMWVGAS